MAIITEEQEEEINKTHKPISSSSTSNPGTSSNGDSPTANAFIFWAYFTIAVSVFTLLVVSLSSLFPQDDKSWFLSLPTDLRLHYSMGKTIKVQINPNGSPIEVFAIEQGSRKNTETVFLVHGLGSNSYSFRNVIKLLGLNGIHAVAIDLPGSGFSDKSSLEEDNERFGGVFGGFWEIYSDIKEKGLFWGFDQLIETGGIPYEENEIRASNRKTLKPLELKPDEIGRIIGQVIDSMGLSPVHLVLHDSAFGMSANWVTENLGLVSSLTLIDSSSKSIALPLWVFEMPIVRDITLGFSTVYERLLRSCCSKSINVSISEAHRVLLKGRDGRKSIVGTGKGLNYTFDLGEWASTETLKDFPIQVLWSSSWSEEWSEEGHQVANKLPQARFFAHSGGRWPQEDAADEVTEIITRFVSSLPKSVKHVIEEPMPEHIQKIFDDSTEGGHDHNHGHDHHMGQAHQANYMDAYGLGHGWGS